MKILLLINFINPFKIFQLFERNTGWLTYILLFAYIIKRSHCLAFYLPFPSLTFSLFLFQLCNYILSMQKIYFLRKKNKKMRFCNLESKFVTYYLERIMVRKKMNENNLQNIIKKELKYRILNKIICFSYLRKL